MLLHLMAGSKEDAETVTAFFEDMKMRGVNDPLLVTSDGAPGIIKAIEVCFPRAARQRCLAHRMRNLAAKVPEDIWPDFKARVQAAYQAPSRAIARELAAGIVADYGQEAGTWSYLLHGRLRALHCAPAIPGARISTRSSPICVVCRRRRGLGIIDAARRVILRPTRCHKQRAIFEKSPLTRAGGLAMPSTRGPGPYRNPGGTCRHRRTARILGAAAPRCPTPRN